MFNMYGSIIQKNIGPAGYHKDHKDRQSYLDHSAFLPYLNNEKQHNRFYSNKENFEKLNHLTMVKFIYDPIIYPIESSWFGEVAENGEIIKMEETLIY